VPPDVNAATNSEQLLVKESSRASPDAPPGCERARPSGCSHDVSTWFFRMRHHAEYVAPASSFDDDGYDCAAPLIFECSVDHASAGASRIEHRPNLPAASVVSSSA